jgi:IS5 family transposase
MAEKAETERGRNIYHQRIAIADSVFADIKYKKGLDRVTLRGKIKVNIQWVLYCMVHNIVTQPQKGEKINAPSLSESFRYC